MEYIILQKTYVVPSFAMLWFYLNFFREFYWEGYEGCYDILHLFINNFLITTYKIYIYKGVISVRLFVCLGVCFLFVCMYVRS